MKVSLFEFAAKAKREVFNAIANITTERSSKRFKLGSKDDIPNAIIRNVVNSGTATIGLKRLATFIEGDGFSNETLANEKANKTQNFDQLLNDVSLNAAYFEGVALRVFFNNSGEVAQIQNVQWQKLRPKEDGSWVFNELMGESLYQKRDDLVLLPFEPDLAKRKVQFEKDLKDHKGKQAGQIITLFNKGMGLYYDKFPIPSYYSGIEDIQSDGGISKLENRNIKKGWRANMVISTGKIDNELQDEDGHTDKDYFDAMLNGFTGEDASSILHLEGETPEDKPQITVLNIAEMLDATDKATERLATKVCRLIGVPPVLIGIETPGKLGDNQALVNQMKLFNLTVNRLQRMISGALNVAFPDKDFSIKSLSLFDNIPDWVLQKLTDDEIRTIYELPKKEEGVSIEE